jgi:hypothetical protein
LEIKVSYTNFMVADSLRDHGLENEPGERELTELDALPKQFVKSVVLTDMDSMGKLDKVL